jgi:hypothetical protein
MFFAKLLFWGFDIILPSFFAGMGSKLPNTPGISSLDACSLAVSAGLAF